MATASIPDAERAISKALFSSRHMLSLIVAIVAIDNDEFTAPQLERATGLSASTVHQLVTRLVNARLIERIGSISTDRVVRYVRRDPQTLETLARLPDAE